MTKPKKSSHPPLNSSLVRRRSISVPAVIADVLIEISNCVDDLFSPTPTYREREVVWRFIVPPYPPKKRPKRLNGAGLEVLVSPNQTVARVVTGTEPLHARHQYRNRVNAARQKASSIGLKVTGLEKRAKKPVSVI